MTRARGGSDRIEPRGYRGVVLAMLLLVYTLNFLDRQIIGVLAVPIRAELGLSDLELGALGGLAFALFYTALGIPIARLADRGDRSAIVAVALAVWSAFTALCGLAGGFWQLFLFRVGVGVGEAGGVAPSHALIADYFPPGSRARALAIYSFGVPLGSALGIFAGGWIASTIGWRMAFIIVGVAGLLLAPIFRLVVREPRRGRLDPPATTTARPPFATVLRTLRGKPAFWLLAGGAAANSMVGYGLAFWLPSFFARSFGLALFDLSLFYGTLVLVGGVTGIWAGGWLGDRLGARSRAFYALVPMAGALGAAPFYAAGVLAEDRTIAFFLFLPPTALALMWLGPVLAAVQQMVPPAMRATASAIFLFFNNLIGLGGGTLLLGSLSDALAPRFGSESLRYAILIGLSVYLVAAALFAAAARHLARDLPEPAARS